MSALCKFLQQSHRSVLVPIHVRPVAPGQFCASSCNRPVAPGQFCASSCNRLFFEEGSSPARAGNDSSSFWIVARLLAGYEPAARKGVECRLGGSIIKIAFRKKKARLLRPLRYTQPLRKFATARGDAGVCHHALLIFLLDCGEATKAAALHAAFTQVRHCPW